MKVKTKTETQTKKTRTLKDIEAEVAEKKEETYNRMFKGKKMPPKEPGGTPKPATKKAIQEQTVRQYAVTVVYAGLRNTGYPMLVAGAMLRSIGATDEHIQQAAVQYGDDMKKEGDGDETNKV